MPRKYSLNWMPLTATISIVLIIIEGYFVNSIDVADELESLPYSISETENYLKQYINSDIENAESDLDKAILLMSLVHDKIVRNYTYEYMATLQPIDILENSKGGCGQYAIVFTSLCAISGLKSRLVNVKNNQGEAHIISEVSINGGWKVFDATHNTYYDYNAWELHNQKTLITEPAQHIELFQSLYDNIIILEHCKNYDLQGLLLYIHNTEFIPSVTVNEENYKIFYGREIFWHHKFTTSRHPLLYSIIIFVGYTRLIFPVIPTILLIHPFIYSLNYHYIISKKVPNHVKEHT